MSKAWPQKRRSVTNLLLDQKNPRLSGRVDQKASQRELIKLLFEQGKAMDVAESIAKRGFFQSEPLLGVEEDGKVVILEGNRRLAALKALREPSILEGKQQRRLEVVARSLADPESIALVPVTLAPTRRAADAQLAGRHAGPSVLPWDAESRAGFVIGCLNNGYSEEEVVADLGLAKSDIVAARQTIALTKLIRALSLDTTATERLAGPKSGILSTLQRVLASAAGQKRLHIEADTKSGFVIKTSKTEFLKGFGRLVDDLLAGRQSSRSLNTATDIEGYFKSWKASEQPKKKRGTLTPDQVSSGKKPSPRKPESKPPSPAAATKTHHVTIVPKSFKMEYGSSKLVDIHGELTKLNREKFPNAGAILLRVFLELSIVDYLERMDLWDAFRRRLAEEGNLPTRGPRLQQLVKEIEEVLVDNMPKNKVRNGVKKALEYSSEKSFNVQELNDFVHSGDLPSARDILVFWNRIEPLFALMLQEEKAK